MYKSKAAAFRKASRLIGYLGVLACIVAGAVWYIYSVVINEKTLTYLQIAGKNVFPKGTAPLTIAIVAAAFIVIAVALRIVSAVFRANSIEETVEYLNAKEAEEDDADEDAYLEESLSPVGEPASLPAAASVPALSAPVEKTVSASAEPSAVRAVPASAPRALTRAEKKVRKAEKKARRKEKTAKVKVTIGKTVDKAFPPEKRAKLKKKVDAVKRAAKVVVPVTVACVAVAVVVKKREEKKRAKQKARNRRQFYEWLG